MLVRGEVPVIKVSFFDSREDFFNKLKDAASLADNKFKELLEKENENKRTDRVKDKTNDYKI